MAIPQFTIDGILPPYVGPQGPGGTSEDMSPYAVTAQAVVKTLGLTDQRKSILQGWLRHRSRLRALGFRRGFQWLDGSFVEKKEPKDLDIVSFLYRPQEVQSPDQLLAILRANPDLFSRGQVKVEFGLDAFLLDLDGSVETILSTARYFLGLFSHRREDDIRKGMLQVRLEDAIDDAAASALLSVPPLSALSEE